MFDKTMDDHGGSNNAYTSSDVTVYTDWFPSAALEVMFDMEADRIRDLAFDPKIIESERGVVYSERRRRWTTTMAECCGNWRWRRRSSRIRTRRRCSAGRRTSSRGPWRI